MSAHAPALLDPPPDSTPEMDTRVEPGGRRFLCCLEERGERTRGEACVVVRVVRERDIIIETPSAALAGTLRMHQLQMKKAAATDKRLILRIR